MPALSSRVEGLAGSQQTVACDLDRSRNCLHTAWINTETRAGTKPQLETSTQKSPSSTVREALLTPAQGRSCPGVSVRPQT